MTCFYDATIYPIHLTLPFNYPSVTKPNIIQWTANLARTRLEYPCFFLLAVYPGGFDTFSQLESIFIIPDLTDNDTAKNLLKKSGALSDIINIVKALSDPTVLVQPFLQNYPLIRHIGVQGYKPEILSKDQCLSFDFLRNSIKLSYQELDKYILPLPIKDKKEKPIWIEEIILKRPTMAQNLPPRNEARNEVILTIGTSKDKAAKDGKKSSTRK